MSGPVFLGVIVAWALWGVASLFLSFPISLVVGTLGSAAMIVFFRDSLMVGGLMALLEPIGIILPLLVLRHVAGQFGWSIPDFSSVELVLFLLVYVAFLMTAFGVIPVDLYRLGYAPLYVGGVVLLLCLYGALTGNWFVPLAAVLAQILWILGVGSSNYFDHILHVVLVPVAFTVLLIRLVG